MPTVITLKLNKLSITVCDYVHSMRLEKSIYLQKMDK